MSESVDYDEKNDLVVVAYSGFVDVESVRSAAVIAADMAFRQDTTRVLVDCRDVDLAMSAADIQLLPATIADALSRQSIPVSAFRRAVVFARDWEDYSAIEAAAGSQGQDMRVFESVDEAKAWLVEA